MVILYFVLSMEKEHKYYRPLPDGLTIKHSEIEGLGLFATKQFPIGTRFGISHIKNDFFPDGYIRTPLGGFYNNSENPNCESVEEGEYKYLVSLKEINEGDELTSTYRLYNPND